MRISIFGMGYVGLVSAACLAKEGHTVIGVDANEAKVDMINDGISPIVENQTPELIQEAVAKGTLRATTDVEEAVLASELSLDLRGDAEPGQRQPGSEVRAEGLRGNRQGAAPQRRVPRRGLPQHHAAGNDAWSGDPAAGGALGQTGGQGLRRVQQSGVPAGGDRGPRFLQSAEDRDRRKRSCQRSTGGLPVRHGGRSLVSHADRDCRDGQVRGQRLARAEDRASPTRSGTSAGR